MACTGGWISFNITTNSTGDDGCVQFTYTLSGTNNDTLNSGAVLQYKETDTADAKTVFTTTAAVTESGTSFSIPSSSMTAGNFHIPSKGTFAGGDYNSVSNVVFTPNSDGTYSISGTFSHVTPQDDPPDCDWNASSSGFEEKKGHKAAY